MGAARGFTLIEIVVALALAGLLVSLAGPNMVGSLVGSAKSLQNLNTAVTLQSTMEKIVSCYPIDPDLTSINTCITSKLSTGFTKVDAKTGYCKVVGSAFVVDDTLSSGMYALTIKSDATGELLTMLFPGKKL
jgi:prepilin-type N-terminal cleavage/methylation domain-containing protein